MEWHIGIESKGEFERDTTDALAVVTAAVAVVLNAGATIVVTLKVFWTAAVFTCCTIVSKYCFNSFSDIAATFWLFRPLDGHSGQFLC